MAHLYLDQYNVEYLPTVLVQKKLGFIEPNTMDNGMRFAIKNFANNADLREEVITSFFPHLFLTKDTTWLEIPTNAVLMHRRMTDMINRATGMAYTQNLQRKLDKGQLVLPDADMKRLYTISLLGRRTGDIANVDYFAKKTGFDAKKNYPLFQFYHVEVKRGIPNANDKNYMVTFLYDADILALLTIQAEIELSNRPIAQLFTQFSDFPKVPINVKPDTTNSVQFLAKKEQEFQAIFSRFATFYKVQIEKQEKKQPEVMKEMLTEVEKELNEKRKEIDKLKEDIDELELDLDDLQGCKDLCNQYDKWKRVLVELVAKMVPDFNQKQFQKLLAMDPETLIKDKDTVLVNFEIGKELVEKKAPSLLRRVFDTLFEYTSPLPPSPAKTEAVIEQKQEGGAKSELRKAYEDLQVAEEITSTLLHKAQDKQIQLYQLIDDLYKVSQRDARDIVQITLPALNDTMMMEINATQYTTISSLIRNKSDPATFLAELRNSVKRTAKLNEELSKFVVNIDEYIEGTQERLERLKKLKAIEKEKGINPVKKFVDEIANKVDKKEVYKLLNELLAYIDGTEIEWSKETVKERKVEEIYMEERLNRNNEIAGDIDNMRVYRTIRKVFDQKIKEYEEEEATF